MVMNIPPEEIQEEQEHLSSTIREIDAAAARIRQSLPSEAAHQEAAELEQKRRLAELASMEAMQSNPYFGRVVFELTDPNGPRSIYIGRHSFLRQGPYDVFSWQAPVARLFYRPRDGRYIINGQEQNAQVTLKRELTIEDSQLTAISDALRLTAPIQIEALPSRKDTRLTDESVAEYDSALTRSLEATGQRELQEIVATIQPEQYSLIAETDCTVMIVQGAAGSGKSEIGLQRLAFLLAPDNQMPEGFRPQADRVLMIGPSVAFLNFVKNLLPSLETQPIAQSTLREWLLQHFSQRIRLGQNNRLFQDLMSNQPKYTKNAFAAERFKGSLEMKRTIERYVRRRQGEPYGHFADEYLRMVESEATLLEKGVTASRPFVDTDLAPMLYMDHLLNGQERPRYEHVVIDEAQDVSPLEVHLLLMHSRNGWFTILGDLRQRLTPYRGVSNWQELRRVFPQGDAQRYEARLSYRSTAQITKLGNRILRRLPEQGDQPIPYAREGDPPKLHRSTTVREMYSVIADRAVEALANEQTVAVLTRTSQDADYALRRLQEEDIDEAQVLRMNDVIDSGLVICPILLAKGLEFDLVLIAGVDAQSFTGSEMDNRLLYLATTRARHRLEFHWVGAPSPLIEKLGAVGMEVAGNLDTSRGKRGVFDRSRPRRRGHRSRRQPPR